MMWWRDGGIMTTITDKILDVLQQIINDKLGAISVNPQLNGKQILIKMTFSDSFDKEDMQRILDLYNDHR